MMDALQPKPGATRLLLAALWVGGLVAMACSPRPSPTMPDMRTPVGVISQSWCEVPTNEGVRLLSVDACVEDGLLAEERLVRRAAITSRGTDQVMLLDSREAPARFLNLDTSTPGRTGVRIPGGPGLIVNSGIRGIGLVASDRPATLTVVDLDAGRALARLSFDAPLTQLTHVPGSRKVAWVEGESSTLTVSEVEVRCGDVENIWIQGCSPDIRFREVSTFTVPGIQGLVSTASGQLVAQVRGSTQLPRFAVAGRALGACGGEPCVLPDLELRPACDDSPSTCDDRFGSTWNQPILPGPMVATPEGDILIVAELRRSELLFLDLEEGVLLTPNAGHPTERSAGVVLSGRLIKTLVPFSSEGLFQTSDGTLARSVARTVFALTSFGELHLVDIDRLWSVIPPDGGERTFQRDPRFRRLLAGSRSPAVRSVVCDLPGTLRGGRIGTLDERCNLTTQPRLAALDPESPLTGPWTSADPSRIIALPTEPAVRFSSDLNALETFERVDPWYVASDTWSVTWEGVLPRTQRNDYRIEGSTLALRGAGLCDDNAGHVVCDSGLDLGLCPAARDLCRAGVEPCSLETPICTLCPELCARYADACDAGIEVGDVVVLDALVEPIGVSLPPSCAPFLRTSVREPVPQGGRALEYRIVSRTPTRLEVEPLGRDDTADRLPPEECIRGLLTASVRPSEAWVLSGRRLGYDAVTEAEGDQCVERAGRHLGASRPVSGELFTSRHGITFLIEEGTESPERDFRFQFVTERGRTDFVLRTGVSATHAAPIARPNRNEGLLVADDLRSSMILYDLLPANLFDPDRFLFGIAERF